MFTGIVEEKGQIVLLDRKPGGARLTVQAVTVHEGARLGDSIANNGCCLTVVAIEADRLSFDLLDETLDKTNIGSLMPGDPVNLERSIRADGRLGGHFVTGHIDTKGTISKWESNGKDYTLEINYPEKFMGYVVPKGCIAVDGISLTLCECIKNTFRLWIIPHTIEVTNLSRARVGAEVNLEFDLVAKYTESILSNRKS